jgi:integrase
MGSYDASGARGLTLPAARDQAAEWSALYRNGVHDLHGHFERLRSEEARAREAAQKADEEAREQAQHGTLAQLLWTYTDHLGRLGKSSVKDVLNIFKNHVLTGHAALASRKANAVGVEEFVELIGRVVAAGKGRTAAKLRSYLRAAYALAIEAKTDPAAPAILTTFGISTNPLASIGALSQFNRARHRHLAAAELAAFLQRLDPAPASAQKDALEVAIALGGQRPTQLLRARSGDVDLVSGTITLYDPKGARSEPRVHVIPLSDHALMIVARRLDALCGGGNAPVFTTDGVTPMRLETLSEFVFELSQVMVEANESREPFQLRDLRRTLETLLARLGVSRDVRGQVQSHGLGGVQNRHYDRHEYWDEKRATLALLEAHLTQLRSGKSAVTRVAATPSPAATTSPVISPDWAILSTLDLTP